MHRTQTFKGSLFASLSLLLVVALGPAGCASEIEDDAADDDVVEEVDTTMQPLSACTIAGGASGAAAGFAVSAWWATGACAGGTLVTTAGVATPICVVPATAAAAGTLAAVVAGGAAFLACNQLSGWVQARRQAASGTYQVRCNIAGPWGKPQCNGAVTASGSSCSEAKAAADAKIPAGCYKRHCHETGNGKYCR